MPEDLWRIEKNKLILRRPFSSSDLGILQKYAPRVRVFCPPGNVPGQDRISLSIFQALAMMYARQPLFPNLEVLRWDQTRASHLFAFTPLFLSNRLKILQLRLPRLSVEQLSFFITLPVLVPNVKVLNLSLESQAWSHQDNDRTLTESLCQWSCLASLTIQDISIDDLFCIAKLPKLSCLFIRHNGPAWQKYSSNASGFAQLSGFTNLQHPFSMLQSLALDDFTSSLRGLNEILRLFRDALLVDLLINMKPDQDTMDNLQELFRVLMQRCDHMPLRRFSFRFTTEIRSKSISFTLFSPLMKFTSLNFVEIGGPAAVVVVEEQANQIASSWPNLRALKLGSVLNRQIPPKLMKLSALLLLSRNCPNLHTLEVAVNAADATEHDSLTKCPEDFRGVRNYMLKNLSVGASPIQNKEFIAIFLSEIYPAVKVTSKNPDDRAAARRWEYVGNVLLPMIVGARKRERDFLGVENSSSRGNLKGRATSEEQADPWFPIKDDISYIRALEGRQVLKFEWPKE
ncbi:hypothetical protein NP233_g172 [Leucocoprinus birnbaumii]|uniref:Uncharacterized protein n=1 Tax=Leucocoprinus birnbaumii TaxID=56174 RepID=A0AAD5W4L7_9AGAR|nr:hypothetical protein NP233_g172 [Leucocoprinus birnbaumii]